MNTENRARSVSLMVRMCSLRLIYLFNFSAFVRKQLFFRLKKIFLSVTLRMYYAIAQLFISLIKRKKTIQEISLNQRNFSLTL